MSDNIYKYIIVNENDQIIRGPFEPHEENDAVAQFNTLVNEGYDCALIAWVYEYSENELIDTSTGAPTWPDPKLQEENE